MIKLYFLSLLFCITFFSCKQSHVTNQKQAADKTTSPNDTNRNESFFIDTGKIAILPIDTSNPWVFKDATALQLTNQDLQTIEKLIADCINFNNRSQDTTKRFSEYIDLKNYKRQYVPFINSKSEKKVYVNCFCFLVYNDEFDYWKKSLVEVKDGGSCFFHLTINLTTKTYEQLYTNGYA